jgi:nucleotide-binding universal stress UspA family protein
VITEVPSVERPKCRDHGGSRRLLVGTDGSDSSYRAVDRAAEIARDTAARLVIVCAYEPATSREVATAEDVLGDEAYTVAGSAPAGETLRTAAERATVRGAGKIDRVAVEGEPVKSLIGALEEHQADLLVVGNRGLNTIAGRLLGSVPAAVARRSPCDVLIVHTVS